MKVKDPVCGMATDEHDAAGTFTHQGKTYHFCSTSCKEKFEKDPESFVGEKASGKTPESAAENVCPMHPEVRQTGPGSCPKCGMALEPARPSPVTSGHAVYKSISAGLGGATGLVFFYFILLGLLSDSWRHPLDELLNLKYWIGALVVGFGTQVGLYYHIRKVMHVRQGGKAAAAGTATSTAAMVACCAHHLTDVLPIIGLAGVALFLSEYKIAFIIFGIISNVVGIMIMARILRRSAAAGRISAAS